MSVFLKGILISYVVWEIEFYVSFVSGIVEFIFLIKENDKICGFEVVIGFEEVFMFFVILDEGILVFIDMVYILKEKFEWVLL